MESNTRKASIKVDIELVKEEGCTRMKQDIEYDGELSMSVIVLALTNQVYSHLVEAGLDKDGVMKIMSDIWDDSKVL